MHERGDPSAGNFLQWAKDALLSLSNVPVKDREGVICARKELSSGVIYWDMGRGVDAKFETPKAP